jgi:tRNA threonylcarbamoyladenosine biosynthesis protein TsaB
MPSLQQLRATGAPLLLIDAASACIQAGVLGAAGGDRWASATEEAGIGIFRCVEALQFDLAEAGAFIFCDGPGSILGIRSTAMALRTWNVLKARPVYRYCSLELVAHALREPGTQVIADARRETWHRFTLGGRLERIATADLAGPLVMPAGFRHWSALPLGVTPTSYTLATLLPAIADADLFTASESPDAFLHEEPSYKTWTPQIHRAPTP